MKKNVFLNNTKVSKQEKWPLNRLILITKIGSVYLFTATIYRLIFELLTDVSCEVPFFKMTSIEKAKSLKPIKRFSIVHLIKDIAIEKYEYRS